MRMRFIGFQDCDLREALMSSKRSYGYIRVAVVAFMAFFSFSALGENVAPLQNRWLTVSVRPADGSFEVRSAGLKDPVFAARVGAEIEHQWVSSTDYPKHEVSSSTFHDALGEGNQMEVSFAGLAGKPGLKYTLQLYNDRPYGSVQVAVVNTGSETLNVEDIRVIDVIGEPRVNLGAPE